VVYKNSEMKGEGYMKKDGEQPHYFLNDRDRAKEK